MEIQLQLTTLSPGLGEDGLLHDINQIIFYAAHNTILVIVMAIVFFQFLTREKKEK